MKTAKATYEKELFIMAFEPVKRNVLLNPGPATTTDTVKYAQVVPDICPREKEFGDIMRWMRGELVKIVHGDPEKYTSVLFTGSGTMNIDVCVNSLLPEGKKILFVDNGAYTSRGVEVAQYYHLPYIDMKFAFDERPDLAKVEEALRSDPDIAVVYTTHNETGTGILNPIKDIGEIAHRYGCTFVVDTTSTYAMIPIDMDRDNIDFVMASAQKGLMAFTGLSFIVGNKELIEKSKDYPTRSYYCNLYLQYDFFEKTGEMHFTPPVQTVYATKQAILEYWADGEEKRYQRHIDVWNAIHEGKERLGFRDIIKREWQSGMVVSIKYPNDPNWDFKKIHDYCYEREFTIYPGKVASTDTFRLCTLGQIYPEDIKNFWKVFEEACIATGVSIPAEY